MTILTEETSNNEGCVVTIQKIPKVHRRAIIGVSFVQDPYSLEDYLITCAHDGLKVWHMNKSDPGMLTEKQEIKGWRSGAQDFDVTPDGTSIVDDNLSFSGARQISSVSYSPDSKMIAIANNEGIVTILDAPKLEIRFFFEAHAVKIRATCFSPSSDTLLTGSDDKIVKLYIIFASSSNDGCIILWSTVEDCALHVFQGTHEGVVKGLSFSVDGMYIASVGEDRAVCLHRLGIQERFAENNWPTNQNMTAAISLLCFSFTGLLLRIVLSINIYQEHQNGENQQTDYSARATSGNSMLTASENRKSGEEEDELLIRARRDLEGIGEVSP